MSNLEKVHKIAAVSASLGESPVCDSLNEWLYFVDISAGRTYRLLLSGKVETLCQSAALVGALALTDRGHLIFTEDVRAALLNVESGVVYAHSLSRWIPLQVIASMMVPAIHRDDLSLA